MWKRGEIAPKSNFSSFPHYYIYIFLTSGVKLYIHLLNVIVQFIVFLTLSTLICRGTDISKYFSESLGMRDNESRLYSVEEFIKSERGYYKEYPVRNSNIQWERRQIRVSTSEKGGKYLHIRVISLEVLFIPLREEIIPIAADKRGYPHNIFLISPRKHMLWVLIRSASSRRF